METWTIQKLLNWTVGYFTEKKVDSPRLSAELLLAHVMNMKRIELYMHFDRQASPEQLKTFRSLVRRCAEHEPPAYLTGYTEFYSLAMKITPDCLIPRPETELLVEKAIDFLRKRKGPQFVCDLCTGCGCIAVAVAKNHPDCNVVATDICEKALSIAAENVRTHKLNDRIKLLCGDLFEPIITGLDNSRFDLIVCNPPYISDAEYEKLAENVRNYEPARALKAGPEGLDVYRKLAEKVTEHLRPAGELMLEIGYKQGQAVRDLLEQAGLECVKVEKDFGKNDRIVTAVKK